jgi:hypothetical protein
MAALDFPTSPTIGQVYSANGGSWIWDGTVWVGGNVTPVTSGGTGATTLTSGYLVKGNGTSAVSASVVYDSGTNVGVGTGSPATKFDVSGNISQNIVAVAALDIDCSLGNFFTKTISANSTFTFSNVPASRAFAFTLELTQTSGTVTWPAAVRWPGGTAPSLTTNRIQLFTFVTDNGGTVWLGASQTNYTA